MALAVFPTLGWQIQLVLFGVLSVLSLVLGRRYLKRYPIATDTPTFNATTGPCCSANRDEVHRPAEPPAHHWPDRPEVVAGLDRTGGESWLGM